MDAFNPNAAIQSREEFVTFVRNLSTDFRDNNVTWENITVERYLEALAAWANDMDGYYKNKGEVAPDDINWNFIAQLLIAAKVYE